MLTEQEAAAELRKRIDDEKLRFYDYIRHVSHLDADGLRNCGYKSREDALTRIIKSVEDKIEKMIREHETKFP